MSKQVIDKNNINYDVYNALNLMHEDLGECYLKQGFNPMEEGFVLDENFVIERFLNAKTNLEILSPHFVNNGDKTTKQALENNQKHCEESLEQINNMLLSTEFSKAQKEELKKLKLYLLCRIELANFYLKNFKKQKNKFKLYLNINSLSWKTSELFEDAYNELFDANLAIANYLAFAKQHSKAIKKELENEKLKQEAKQIIAQNQQIKKEQVVKPAKTNVQKQPTSKATTKNTQQVAPLKERASKTKKEPTLER